MTYALIILTIILSNILGIVGGVILTLKWITKIAREVEE